MTDPLDRARLSELQIKLHCNQSQVAEACEVTALALQHLGIQIQVDTPASRILDVTILSLTLGESPVSLTCLIIQSVQDH
ncbi:MAG: hypothetical protein H7237_11445 [Alkalinema sp. FL-bin-369]|nr:hypothetical protein [Leptolyngbyaceae cyanobacterium LF-bin-369]